MSTLTLVRHGQSMSLERDPPLTPLGEEQARRLAAYWLRTGAAFDEIHCGSLRRHIRTGEIVREGFGAAGTPLPALRVNPDFNEYDASGILGRLAPQLAEQSAAFRELLRAEREHAGTPESNRHFQRMFEALMERWVTAELEADGVEPWLDFRERVLRGLGAILNRGERGLRVAVFTSGGPVGVAVQTALQAPARAAIEINWRVRNCSLTEFVFRAGKFSLDVFNAIPHLEEASLISYR